MTTLASPADLIGQVVDGRYRIRKVLGRGGMGVVYEAEAIRLGKRPCAIKVLLPEYTRNDTVKARFEREAEVAARVKHPNVVEIFDTGQTESGLGYIAMELLVGEPLDRLLKREGPLPWTRAQKILLQICRALAAAHQKGVIHRDVKPENCFRITPSDHADPDTIDDDVIKVLDFGIAKLADIDGDVEAARLTATNSVIGTYAYMSYEQICGDPIDHRVDIWAVGVMLYEMLTGRQPFRGTNQGQIWKAISSYDPEPMRDIVQGIPPGADAIITSALAKDRSKRYPTIDAFARALAGVTGDGAPAVTARLTLPTLVPGAPVIDVSAATDLGADDEDQRPTRQVSPNGLTVLAPDSLRPITDETSAAIAAPSTHPGREQAPPPPREAMQTQIAPVLQPSGTTPFPRTRRVALLALTLLTTTAAVFTLYLTQSPKTPKPEKPDPEPVAQRDPAPPIAATPTAPPITPQPITPEPELVEPPIQDPPTKLDIPPPTRKPAELTYHARLKEELRKARDRKETRECFTRFQVKDALTVDIAITAASGALTVTYPALKAESLLSICLDKALRQKPFSPGKPGDKDFSQKAYLLNPKR